MKKIIAIAFSDLHINLWAKFNKDNCRTLDSFKVLRLVNKVCENNKVPALFCGDLFHKSEVLDNDLGNLVLEKVKNLNFVCWAISGNHDIEDINSIDKPKGSWVKFFSHSLKWLNCIDFKEIKLTSVGKYIIHGVPYIDHNIGLSKYLKDMVLKPGYKHILMLHTDYPGAKDTDGRVIDSAENINLNMLNRFDLVICGHIHKPQRLSKKVYMIGAPIQQRRTDKECNMGYWEIYSDMTLKFVPFKNFPKFIDVETEDEVKEDGNYYTVIPKKTREENHSKHKITKQLSKKKLAKLYLKEKGIKNKTRENLLIDILKKSESC